MPTCSDVKATSLGTDDIPFSFTSGNILKRASSMAYILEIAPPRGQTGLSDLQPPNVITGKSHGDDAALQNRVLKCLCMFEIIKQQQQKSFVYSVSRVYRGMTQHPTVHNVRANHCLCHQILQ